MAGRERGRLVCGYSERAQGRMRWGSPSEYAAYYKLLLTHNGRLEFRGWLERENPSLYQLVMKELKLETRG